MLINFEGIESLSREGVFGGEGVYHVRRADVEKNRVLVGTLEPGASIGMHQHDDGIEAMYFLSGCGEADYDGTIERIEPGVCHYCPKGHRHSVTNTGTDKMVFFAIVTQE